ncbi:unnamed protein product [Meganyctiphanes norvegica]|uniref:Programmed cell death protein 5 n=1 Tax=Meganyctiphanes norvegica TaxID=48144 RepID=A0AAV2QUR5_MEGNR
MEADPELAAIRAKRMAELEGSSQGGMNPQQQQAGVSQAERAAQQQQMQNTLLNQALDQQARARLNTIMLAKPEKGKQVESIICQMAAQGQISGKLCENDLVNLVERINAQTKKKSKVIFDRRRAALDSDSD